MALRLQSNFIDYYDHQFAGSYQQDAPYFSRMSRASLHRKDMFALLQSRGLTTPLHGTVRELHAHHLNALQQQGYKDETLASMLEMSQLVVYTDPYAHAGEGKVLLSVTAALAQHPDTYGSEYLPQNGAGTGVSLRYLRIGRRQFWLRYTSEDDWRSNAGTVAIELLCEEAPKPVSEAKHSPEPLLAVDFIIGPNRTLVAVDHNTAPQLRGTGIEARLSTKDVVDEIATWYAAG